MSQQSVESILGRLITDVAFRERFFAESEVVCRDHDYNLTPTELSALLQVEPRALQNLTESLDPRIVRAVMVNPRRGARGTARSRAPRDRRRQRQAL